MKMFAQIIQSIEDKTIPVTNYLLSFFFIILLAYFFNCFSLDLFSLAFPRVANEIIQLMLSCVILAFLLILSLYYATSTSILTITKFVLTSFLIIWLIPLINMITGSHSDIHFYYLTPDTINMNLWQVYFFGILYASMGLNTAMLVGLICVYFYLRHNYCSIILSLIYTWLIYSIIFIWAASPYLIKWLTETAGFAFGFSTQLLIDFHLLLLLPLLMVYVYLINPFLFKIVAKDSRLLRVMHYQLMLVLGMVLAFLNSSYDIFQLLYFTPRILMMTVFTMISLFFACLFSINVNNLADIEIDKICNQDRPLIKHEMNVQHYRLLGYAFLAISFFYAAMTNAYVFLIISICVGSYYLYSALPIRFKRVTLFSKLVISGNSLALVLLGYILVQKGIYGFPSVLFLIFLAGFTLAANFIDLKDTQGDRAAGVLTLPVLMGEKSAKLLIGSAFWGTYLAFFYLINNYYFIPLLIVAGGIQFYLINRKLYREWLILLFHNISILILIVYFLVLKQYF